MTAGAWEIVGQDYRELPIAKTLGDALRGLIRKRYASNAAKRIERDWDLDPKTAKNVVTQGHVSERTITKAIRAEGWALLMALGAELTGETFQNYEERRLQSLIEEATDGLEKIRSLAVRREEVEARARRAVADLDWSADDEGRGAQSRSWAPLDERGALAPRSTEEG